MSDKLLSPHQLKSQQNRTLPIEQLESRAYLSVSFFAPAFYTGVTGVTGIAAGALTSSGKPDVVVAGLSPSSNVPVVGVYLNNGSGSFAAPTLFPFNGGPGGVGIGKFDSSGKQDIAVVDSLDNDLTDFLGDGSGNFTPGAGGALGGTSGDTALAVGDFNGDGHDDVAVVDPTDGYVQILFSKGDTFGSFAQEQQITVPMPENVIVGDFNGDGHPDLAILSGNGSIYVALNGGNGFFATPVPYSLGSGLTSTTGLASADFNGDKLNDLVGIGASSGGGTAGVLLDQGAGAFGTATDYATSAAPVAAVAGDFSADGAPDIALLGAAGALTVLPGNGDGTFGAAISAFTTQLGSVGNQAIAADFNGDGSPDIAFVSDATGGGFGVALNQVGGIVTPPANTTSVLMPTLLKPLPKGNLIAGQTIKPIHETVKVTNTGKTTFSGKVSLQLALSPTKTTSSSQVDVGIPADPTLVIKAGKSKTVAMTVNSLPANFTGVEYLLALLTDPTGATGLAASSGAVTVVAPTIDLKGAFAKLPSKAKAAKGANFTFNVINQGNITATGDLLIEVTPSATTSLPEEATPIQSAKTVAIKAGKSTAFKIKGVIAAAGTSDYLIVQIVPSNGLDDSDIANPTVVSGTTVAFS